MPSAFDQKAKCFALPQFVDEPYKGLLHCVEAMC